VIAELLLPTAGRQRRAHGGRGVLRAGRLVAIHTPAGVDMWCVDFNSSFDEWDAQREGLVTHAQGTLSLRSQTYFPFAVDAAVRDRGARVEDGEGTARIGPRAVRFLPSVFLSRMSGVPEGAMTNYFVRSTTSA